ncbi:DUF2806 domain-containing protein [Rhizobium leguminosarum]|uniref:DUF2806 domain-containing protein n=1 Tax=Rhizobium leguminosarum TaxID=384 RepID=UPI001C94CF4F|nr:DUF2806 domain-containing protein [Rhizobium leguminosarum]MBY5765080.1 DUF2806 domain-containing protein [Rhizobium leguminosarum]
MSKPTDESIGLDVAWSLQGFSAKLKSRLLSALDRAGARKIDQKGLEQDRKQALHRAMTDVQLALIATSGEALQERIRNDPELAQRALTLFSRAERQAENFEASLGLAVEDLKNNPSTTAEGADSPDVLDPDFLNRWENYASGATSEIVREKWGRVLSSEIREPGTFSLKTLRIIDELDQETAILFQRFCQSRIDMWAPELLLDLSSSELSSLAQAELVLEAELPSTISFLETINGAGEKWWILKNNNLGVVVRQNPRPPCITEGPFNFDPIHIADGKLKLNMIVLTKVGVALSAIIPRDEEAVFRRLAEAISKDAEGSAIFVHRNPDGGMSAVTEEAVAPPAEVKISTE